MKPTVTIGLPVYNAAPFIEDALRSIFAQTLTDWELIAVDDGSSDGGAELLRRLRDPRVRALMDGQHHGLGARLNQIVGLAAGKYVARMDADDLMHPERLERQVDFLENHPAVDVVGCGLISFDAQHRPISVRRLPAEHQAITARPLRGIPLAHATAVGRAQWWKKHPYNERSRRCEDWELWFSSFRESRFANLPEPLYFYREVQAYSFPGYARGKAELAGFLWGQRESFGAPAAAVEAVGQWARIGAYAIAHLAGLDRTLLRRRGQAVREEERAAFESALERVRGVALPF
ncbi:MAG: glycosyltransferase [Acidobacteriia bacterium]|nr:glycosyltransferase [Terriglobia bacterium]